ncbi:styrene monooxygenase/indole monooxygenase family protein [Sciscionella sediminilitoris]|uniref:styrene monooxygenase/indole monooxygenase family protein n=1 Tax=Sciscionella sediminilitoris TaxID=1445613 RepID=UPI0004DF1C77|nr:styrene monooxygenase/indole monooxygenase family protein [Sciscionella sp. SE31]
MPDIGIIGAGTAGLHLALLLQQAGIPTRIYTNQTAEQLASGRPQNSVSHHAPTIAREQAMGVDFWPATEYGYQTHFHYLNIPDGPPLYRGDFLRPSRVLDYRIYLPRLMAEYENRGGAIEQRAVEPADFERLAKRHDLIVVAAGKRSFGEYFGERPDMSPYPKPQRHLAVGFWDGVEQTDPRSVTLSISPGHGELLDLPITTLDGWASALLCENVPGGDLEILMTQKESDDPEAYRRLLLDKLKAHHPTVFERIDQSRFALMRPGDMLQGAVRPVVREDYRLLEDGTVVLALGDAHATVDPVTGQGANSASFEAQVAADAIIEDGVVDERFAMKVALRRRERVDGLSTWVNTMIATPTPPQVQRLLGEMAGLRTLCDEFTENFSHPHRNGDMVATPERVDAAIARHRAIGGDPTGTAG